MRSFIVLILLCLFIREKTFIHENTSRNASITALILARGGSKGIVLKNLATIDGVTLLARSIRAIKESNIFLSIWVSTDHETIAKEAIKEGVNVHIRSAESATDTATSIFAVQEFLRHHQVEVLALVQCTSPFIRPHYLKLARDFISTGKDCVFSVSRSFKLRWKETEDGAIPLNFNPLNRPRRQDWNGELIENGMFYFAKTSLLEEGKFQNESEVSALKYLSTHFFANNTFISSAAEYLNNNP